MKKILFILALLAILLIAGCGKKVDTTVQGNTIEITDKGFSPKELKIKQGDKVTWMNKDSLGHWPASAMHPTHEKYPGSSIKKCGTSEESSIFDACKNVEAGSSWSFTFNEKGTWAYHDHSNPTLFGKVVVE